MPGYEVKVQRVAVAGGENLEIRSLLDRLQYADPDGAAALAGISPASWPLFGQIWPSSQILAGLMQDWQLGTQRFLEIGCGLALASLVVHRRGGDITASDCHPLAETFLRDNLRRNSLPPMKYSTGNWRRPNPALGRFDVLIGSDLLYEPDHPEQLAEFIERHAVNCADVLIIDPNRGHRTAFTRCMRQTGFELADTKLVSRFADGTAYRGHVLRYRRALAID
ncbi:MAG: class I SAM-dependent methyltransferase [Rhodocyclales bacterium]|nr:class I SAM-dependent methyltransferase [Rhodocyclales bacterium]